MVEPPSTRTSSPLSTTTSSTTSSSPAAPRWKFWASRHPPKPSEQPKSGPAPVPFHQLFRYTPANVRLLLLFSLLSAAAHGTMLPVLTVLFGRVIDDATPIIRGISVGISDLDTLSSALADTTRLFLILSFVVWLLSFFQLFLSLRAANAIGNQLRHAFFSSLLRLQPAFYDDTQAGALTVLVVNDVNLIQAAVGDKLATAVQYITTFAAGIVVGFIKGWALTLVILAVTPILLISGAVFGNASADATGDSLGSYAEASGIASETLGQIRTVTAFSAQQTEKERYNRAVKLAYNKSARASIMSGVGLGVAMFFILCIYGLAFWFGSTRVQAGDTSAGDVLVTFFALTLGASSLGTAGPAFKSFSKARAAAPRVFEIIDTVSEIDPMDDEAGQIIASDRLQGRIVFNGVDFNYANRKFDDDVENKSTLVLDKFNLDIAAGSSEALVGKSGCGKSTVARLVQRMYDPIEGSITLDGVDLRDLNVRWLRSQIGVVAQTPSLFMMSIRENIALGAGVTFERDAGTNSTTVTPQEVTQDDIVAAAKLANAHDFISKLPEGYDTMLGERGAMLSGGQKQRVCIARALVRNPRILVLDESTASLDTASERIVQEALERASSGRTTVTIAHRLSTVRNADSISCIESGQVVERGTHDDLIHRDGGFYRGLFELQNIERAKMEAEKADEQGDEVHAADLPAAAAESTGHENEKSTTTKGVGKDSVIGKGGAEEEDKPAVDKGVFMRTLKYNATEWPLLLLGIVGALVAAVVWPISSIALVEMIYILVEEEIDKGAVRKWSLAFVILAVAALLGNGCQHGLLGISGERLTMRLRQRVFGQLLRMEMGYFDMKENSLGMVTTLLASDAGLVKGLTGELMGIGLNIVGSLVCAMIIAFLACWRLTLVVLAIIPGVALGGYFEMQASAGIDSGARKEFAEANAVAAEAVDNVGTVRSLGREGAFVEKYLGMIEKTAGSKMKKDLITGFAFGFSEFCQYLIWYATFKAGAEFNEFCSFKDVLQSSMALLFGAITLGNVSIFAPDVAASKVSATAVYRLLDRVSAIDPMDGGGGDDGEGEGDDREGGGNVKADGVFFEYPRRPDVAVLRGLTVAIEQGKTLAIVGTSGHGKSTIIGLLERFYDIRKGRLTVDEGQVGDIRPVGRLRGRMGLVSQEPELFNRSVYDNIAYGLPHDGSVVVTQAAVERAAKVANAHEFIVGLPKGYDTLVGARGDKLSGGQKQRVAIARSVIREPSVLLLDEATSALDGESERIVQKALENAGEGRTTIVVAHRLSTVKEADVIAVVRRGRVVECGTHETLLRKNGHYATLVESQLTEV